MPWEEALDMAYQLNESLAEHPKGKLPETKIIELARIAWEDAQTKEVWGGPRRSVVRMTGDEIERYSPDALKLLGKFRKEHSARCARGETFIISAHGFDKSGFMPRKRVEKARLELLMGGAIKVVSKAVNTSAGRAPAQFTLALPTK
jgi:hypothetical protein